MTEWAPLRVASIGLGWVATNRHLPVMQASPHYEVVGVIDRTPGRAESVAGKRRIPYSSALELSRTPWIDKVEAVVIATSPFSHFDIARSALLLGKHVLCEKPLAMCVREGEELVTLADARNLTLGVVHNFQFARSTRRLVADIEAGRLGKLRSISGCQLGNPKRRLPDWYEELPLGLFYDESPHLFYLLHRLAAGGLRFLRCDLFPSTTGLVTPAVLVAHFACEAEGRVAIPVFLNLRFESALSEWSLIADGDQGIGIVDIFRDIYVFLPNDGAHTVATIVRSSALATYQHWAQHVPNGIKHLRGRMWYGNDEVFRRFAVAVRRHEPPAGISGREGLSVLRMQHQVIERHQVLG